MILLEQPSPVSRRVLHTVATDSTSLVRRGIADPTRANGTYEQNLVEAWAQGFNVGTLFLLILLVVCNYRRHVLLHKLILLELVLAIWHGIFIFFNDPAYGWVLSGTAIALYVSYSVHNLVSWYKIKPFLSIWANRIFIYSLLVVQPYWVLETWANFQYFNMLGNTLFIRSRYFEALVRDPWWIFTAIKLVWAIKNTYNYTLTSLVQTSSRFGVMLLCVLLSIIFLMADIAVTIHGSEDSGINPFWRFALVFKCASDVIFLDDFKSVLDHLSQRSSNRAPRFGHTPALARRTEPGAAANRQIRGSQVLGRDEDSSITVPVRAKSRCTWEEQSDNSGGCWVDLSHNSERTPDDDENARTC